MKLDGKRIAVIGAGGSGRAAAALALSCGALVEAFDSGAPEKLAPAAAAFAGLGVPFVCGEAALRPPRRYDLAIISPGIDASWPIGRAFAEASAELVGEIEFAWRLGEAPVIAITGTNGKTTTTSLIAELLRAAGLRAVAAGNIGLAYSEVVLRGEPLDWIVLETSSFQLETVATFAPRVAVWTNFAPDHMDRYATVEDYHAAKLRLFENLGPDGLAVCKLECDLSPPGRLVTFSAFSPGGDYGYEGGEVVHFASGRRFPFAKTRLQGRHNAENLMAALAVADGLGIGWDRVEAGILAFAPPPHRCEKVAEIGGVLYLNDSKSTNLHSLESALAGQEAPVVLLAGGKDKGLDFAELRELAGRQVREVFAFGEIAAHIAAVWSGQVPCRLVGTVEEAVAAAAAAARPGETVLFSPGTSSFDQFSGYEARGEAFRRAVLALADAPPPSPSA
jgi:UDP-N-acetylmuramoylalanine--D-glutamate ligase